MAPQLDDIVIARIEDAMHEDGFKASHKSFLQLANNYRYLHYTIYR